MKTKTIVRGVVGLMACWPLLGDPVPRLAAEELPVYRAVPKRDADFYESLDGGPPKLLPGCSWYCAGDIRGVKASSELPAARGITYAAKNAHDFDPRTAWVEGVGGDGEGEYLEYTFLFDQPDYDGRLGITTVILSNGYKKSRELWRANSRVKKMKMYVDGKARAFIDLLDRHEVQTIEIGKIMFPPKKRTVIRFEILEVFPGEKYQDTAITDLVFEGVGAH